MTAPPSGRRTALVVVVPAAEPLVARFRARHHADAVVRAIPPHVTVLFPFVPAEELGDAVNDDVRQHAAGLHSFDAELSRVATFARHVWLAPTPREHFVDLLRRTYERFPTFPPYGVAHLEPEPHLTVGEATSAPELTAIAAAAERELASGLPVPFRVEALTLFEEGADRKWGSVEAFDLARA